MLGLVLGGGSAKGYAHIGVIRLLEELNIKPDIIVGASMGALIGGFYAKGFSAQKMEEIAVKIDKKKKRELFRFGLHKAGFISGKNIERFLFSYLGDTKIEELSVKYAAVAADIEDNREIIIDRGDLVQAVRSAIAIPVIFIPNHYKGRILIDGGFINPLPIDIVKMMGAKKIIAVNVLPMIDYLKTKISSKEPSNKNYSMKDIFMKTFFLVSSRLIEYQILKFDDGLLINIDTNGIGLSQFEMAEKAIKMGYEQARKYKVELQNFLN
jgi:NTE family protein|uniref:PNPLA domain-containing protein n=1 Tax=candidate division WOR-3 bacterium TaxID=2052148 RepID=A0A7C4TD48_UNCW3